MNSSEENIKFSVLIPVYNVEIHWLQRAIESVVNLSLIHI